MKYLLFILPMLLISLSAKDIAIVKSIEGSVSAKSRDSLVVLKNGDWLSQKMSVITGDKSSVTIIFKDNSVVVLGSNSILILQKYTFQMQKKKYKFKLKLQKGTASFESGKIGELSPEDFTFVTPEATVGIRGTKFIVKVQ